MNIFYYTFGCKVNQYETENIKQNLESRGFSAVNKISDCDIAVVNTCTVTAHSDLKCRQLLHKIKKQNPNSVVVLTGCFPQAFSDDAEQMTDCDIVTGASNKTKIPDFIEEFLVHRQRIISIPAHTKEEKFESMVNDSVETKTRAYIKIQDGCDQYCTYCIIPYARGHIRSKPIEDIKQEAKILHDSGHMELVLVGINLCCYGNDFNNDVKFVDAIEAVCKSAPQCRVRLGSIEPEMISDEDISRLSSLENLCPQFHLSLQSGCNKTLKAMNRKYTADEYELLCKKLKKAFPNCSFTTDVMVGFAGETDEDFKESLDFVKKIGFSKVHIFPYSKREGTVAAKRDDHLPKSIKEKRAAIMDKQCKQMTADYLDSMIGREETVLFEKENNLDFHQGYTSNYVQVKVPAQPQDISWKRKLFAVKIINVQDDFCIGEVIGK